MGAGLQRGRENYFLFARHGPSQSCPSGRGQRSLEVGFGRLWGVPLPLPGHVTLPCHIPFPQKGRPWAGGLGKGVLSFLLLDLRAVLSFCFLRTKPAML